MGGPGALLWETLFCGRLVVKCLRLLPHLPNFIPSSLNPAVLISLDIMLNKTVKENLLTFYLLWEENYDLKYQG